MKKVLILLALLIVSMHSYGESNFVRVPLAKGASIEVPKNWVVISQNNRVNIDAYVEAKGYKLTESNLAFAANLYDDNGKTVALVNARFYPENPFTQQMTSSLRTEDLAVIDKEMQSTTVKTLIGIGGKLEQWKPTEVKKINGLYIIKNEQIAKFPPTNEANREHKYRVWASPRSFTITIGYKQSVENLLEPIVAKMGSSIKLE